MPIIPLDTSHVEALQVFLKDFSTHGEQNIPAFFCAWDADIQDTVENLNAWSLGERLQPGWVPCTTRFFIEEGQLLGVYNFRHHLNEALEIYGGHVGYSVCPSARGRGIASTLLKHARVFGHSLGLDSLVLTCDTTNIGSIRVIERNGGRLRDRHLLEGHQVDTLRFDVPTLS